MNDFHLSGFSCEGGAAGSEGIHYLHNWIKKNGVTKIAEPGMPLLESGKNVVLSIESGAWRIFVGDKKVIGIVGSGGIVWVNSFAQQCGGPSNKYEIVSRSVYYELPEEFIHLAVADDLLLKGVFDFMAWNTSNISRKWLAQCVNDGYAEVKSALEWVNDLSETVKAKCTAISFVTDTTGVSRSHALSIMKSLKQGGYIEMDGGYLVRITRKLPEGY